MPRTLGEFHPLGQTGDGGSTDDCYKLGACPPNGYSYKLGDPEDYDTPDSECNKVAGEVADYLNAIAKGLSMVGTFLDAKAKMDFENSLNRGSSLFNDGKNDLNQAGVQFNESAPTFLDSGSKLNQYANTLSGLKAQLDSQTSDMKNLDAQKSSLEAQRPALDQSLKTAQDQQAYAKNSANYPRTAQGLAQQRTDIRNANLAVANAETAIVNNKSQISSTQNLKNAIGEEYNATLASANKTQAQANAEQARNNASLADMERAQALQNRGYQKVGEGQKTIQEGAQRYQNQKENIIGPVMESATGIKAGADVAGSIAKGENATAVGHSAKSGIEAVARHSGDAGLTRFSGFAGSAILSATKAYDQNQKAGGTTEQGMEQFGRNLGQSTVRYNDMERVGANLDTAKAILDNTTNPNRVKDASDVVVQQVGPSVRIGGQIASTVMSAYPGAEVATPIVNATTEAVAVGGQGLASTLVNTVDKVANGEISVPVGDYPPRPIGRCLVDRTSGGQTSALFTLGAGLFVTGGAMSASLLDGNTDYALKASALIDAIANTGEGMLPRDAVTIRPGFTGD